MQVPNLQAMPGQSQKGGDYVNRMNDINQIMKQGTGGAGLPQLSGAQMMQGTNNGQQ